MKQFLKSFPEFYDFFNFPVDNVLWSSSEEKDHFTVEIEVPGVKKEDLKITSDKPGELVISGKRKGKEFSKAFILNENLDPENIEAKLDLGILHLKLPKKEKYKKTILIE